MKLMENKRNITVCIYGCNTTITVVQSPKNNAQWEIHIDADESGIVVLCEDQPTLGGLIRMGL